MTGAHESPHVTPVGPRDHEGVSLTATARPATDGSGRTDPRLAPLKLALGTRLRAACSTWDPAAFDALIDQIARRKLRWIDLGHCE